jgi:hypothetical protein
MNAFYLSDIHLRLARRASLTLWNRNDENRCLLNLSYGNDDLLGDIAEEARVPDPDWETADDWEPNAKAFLMYMRQDMQTALQYILHHGTFMRGIYITDYAHYELRNMYMVDALDWITVSRLDQDTLRIKTNTGDFLAVSRMRGFRRAPFSSSNDIGLGVVYDVTGIGDTATNEKGAVVGVAIQQFLMKEAWGYSVHEQSKLY